MRNLKNYMPGAPKFQYWEVIKSDTALRLDIDNDPNEKQWQSLESVIKNCMQPIRNEFGMIGINSGFRSLELCLAVGSSSRSNHIRGEAIDFKSLVNVPLVDIIVWIDTNLEYRELILEYNTWIHIGYREGGNIKKLMLKDNSHNYTRVDIEYIKNLNL